LDLDESPSSPGGHVANVSDVEIPAIILRMILPGRVSGMSLTMQTLFGPPDCLCEVAQPWTPLRSAQRSVRIDAGIKRVPEVIGLVIGAE